MIARIERNGPSGVYSVIGYIRLKEILRRKDMNLKYEVNTWDTVYQNTKEI
jgi:hypothetical protein